MPTYTVHVRAEADRTMKVAADSAAEAMNIAYERATRGRAGAWDISFPGYAGEHYDVYLGERRLGPTGYDAEFEED